MVPYMSTGGADFEEPIDVFIVQLMERQYPNREFSVPVENSTLMLIAVYSSTSTILPQVNEMFSNDSVSYFNNKFRPKALRSSMYAC